MARTTDRASRTQAVRRSAQEGHEQEPRISNSEGSSSRGGKKSGGSGSQTTSNSSQGGTTQQKDGGRPQGRQGQRDVLGTGLPARSRDLTPAKP